MTSELSAINPPPSGAYSEKLTKLRESWQTQLSATPTKSAASSASSN